jgi:hypothetical protein
LYLNPPDKALVLCCDEKSQCQALERTQPGLPLGIVASPSLAGIVNNANSRLGQAPPAGGSYSTQENNMIYSQLFSNLAYPTNFYDVTTGSNGAGHNAAKGYDQCTGVGSPRGKTGK